jgi:hypothetical protein
MRLADWFGVKREPESHVLPMNPRASRPSPQSSSQRHSLNFNAKTRRRRVFCFQNKSSAPLRLSVEDL